MYIRYAILTVAALTGGLAVPAECAELALLHRFNYMDGRGPSGAMAQGRDGNIYGTTSEGGSQGEGVIFRISPRGAFVKIHDFASDIDGAEPRGLTLGADGNLYGATETGGGTLAGKAYRGTLFRTTPRGAVTVLHRFKADGTEGRWAYGPPVLGRDGNYYGTTFAGGDQDLGVLYRLTAQGVFKRIHSFSGSDGFYPSAPLSVGSDGNLYGATAYGGAYGYGTAFRITPGGVLTTLHDFDKVNGAYPSGVVQGNDGNWYGTTAGGGQFGFGTVFKLNPKGAHTVLYDFDYNSADGTTNGFAHPNGLVLGSDGGLYGSATYGGSVDDGDCGGLFRITPAGNLTVQATFGPTNGCNPMSIPLMHTNGMLYGSTEKDSNDEDPVGGAGTIYRLGVAAPAFVSTVPPAGKVGTTVGLLGNLAGTSGVKFNGVTASFSGSGSTFRSAVVPAGAATGPLQVTAAAGTVATLHPFRQLPNLNSFSPGFGPVGTVVTLSGSGLSQTTAVQFGSKSASFIVNNDGKLTVNVPVGASTGAIVVTTKGGKATTAPAPFAVTP